MSLLFGLDCFCMLSTAVLSVEREFLSPLYGHSLKVPEKSKSLECCKPKQTEAKPKRTESKLGGEKKDKMSQKRDDVS